MRDANAVRWMHTDTNTAGNADTDTADRTNANALRWSDLGRVQ